jgi:hypothetical protein
VILTYSATSNADVVEDLLMVMRKILRTQITDADGAVLYNLNSIYISSTSEACTAHQEGTPHRAGRAVDISMINNKAITTNYPVDAEVKGICDALQEFAKLEDKIDENFGPMGCFQPWNGKYIKIGGERNAYLISTHKTHLHFRVKAS